MPVDPIHKIGELTLLLENEAESHRRTISLLAAIKSGELSIDRVVVDANAGKWDVLAEDQVPNDSEHVGPDPYADSAVAPVDDITSCANDLSEDEDAPSLDPAEIGCALGGGDD